MFPTKLTLRQLSSLMPRHYNDDDINKKKKNYFNISDFNQILIYFQIKTADRKNKISFLRKKRRRKKIFFFLKASKQLFSNGKVKTRTILIKKIKKKKKPTCFNWFSLVDSSRKSFWQTTCKIPLVIKRNWKTIYAHRIILFEQPAAKLSWR